MGNKEYGQFLASIMRLADRQLASQGGIARRYGIRPVGVIMVCSALSEGWDAFEELATKMNTGYVPFTTSVGATLGVVIAPAALAASALGRIGKSLSFWGGGEKAVSSMYDNKDLVLAVHRIGRTLLPKYKACANDDKGLKNLKEQVVERLIKN